MSILKDFEGYMISKNIFLLLLVVVFLLLLTMKAAAQNEKYSALGYIPSGAGSADGWRREYFQPRHLHKRTHPMLKPSGSPPSCSKAVRTRSSNNWRI